LQKALQIQGPPPQRHEEKTSIDVSQIQRSFRGEPVYQSVRREGSADGRNFSQVPEIRV